LFTAEFEGLEAGLFHEVSGLSIEVEVIEFSEGGINIIRKLPGRAKYPNVVLKRGFTGDLALNNWANAKVLTGDVIRRSGGITMYNQTGGEIVARYHIEDAWPTKWTGPTLQASKNEVAIETLEIAHVGFKREVD
jgi:phage tail-like protein